MNIDPIHRKRLKRRRMLAARVKCHGNKDSHEVAHGKKKVVVTPKKQTTVTVRPTIQKKDNVFKRVSKWLKRA